MMRKFFELWPRSKLYWLIVTLPPMAILLVALPSWYAFGFKAIEVPEVRAVVREYLEVIATFVAILGLFLYGTHRVLSFHPVFDPGYRRWLCATPFEPSRRLPMGPVHLDWRDAVYLAVFAIPTLAAPWVNLSSGLYLFFTGYHAMMALCLWFVGMHRAVTGVAIGLAISVLLLPQIGMALLLQLFIFISIQMLLPRTIEPSKLQQATLTDQGSVALRLILAGNQTTIAFGAINWLEGLNQVPGPTRYERIYTAKALTASPAKVGWPLCALGPYDQLSERLVASPIGYGVLIFLWIWAITNHIPESADPDMPSVVHASTLMIVGLGALYRLIIYCGILKPPISVFGRIATGRLIIPAYDRALIVPGLSVVIASLVFRLLVYSDFTLAFGFAAAVAAGYFALLSGGPSMRSWVLTSPHRIRGEVYWAGVIRKL